ncbi:MAG: RrF2 family transcriptional regulator [Verrucomicrobiia bacterium]
MKISVKTDYAARAVLGLARYYQTGLPQRVETIALENGIPAKYLVQILIELKSRNIVKSVRGKEGGYLLSKPPIEITLGEIVRATHGEIIDIPAILDQSCPIELRNAWKQIKEKIAEDLDQINFQQLIDQESEKFKMFYI